MTEPDTLIVVRIETTELLVTILEELLPGHGLLPACWTDETRNYGHAEFFLETIDEAHRVKGTLEALLADHAEGERSVRPGADLHVQVRKVTGRCPPCGNVNDADAGIVVVQPGLVLDDLNRR